MSRMVRELHPMRPITRLDGHEVAANQARSFPCPRAEVRSRATATFGGRAQGRRFRGLRRQAPRSPLGPD